MPARDHLLQIQKDLYDRFRSNARDSIGELNPALRRYFKEYQKEFTEIKSVSSRSELVEAFLKAPVLIVGDYHTLPQAQRTVLRLWEDALSELQKLGKTPILALEMLRPSDVELAKKWLEGSLSEAAFLEKIQFDSRWGFAWENYRPLFQFAHAYGIRLMGLNVSAKGRKPTLNQRDRHAARLLAKTCDLEPNAAIVALIGDLHLAKAHLPASLERAFRETGKPRRIVVVHQNAERLYWKLASKGMEHTAGVVKLRNNVFCVMNTPPWVKLQSYLKWIEWTAEADQDEGVSDFADDFQDLVCTIQKFAGIRKSIDEAFDIRWRDTGSLPEETRSEKALRQEVLRFFGSYFSPHRNSVFLSSRNVNSAATQAAIYLHARVSGRWRQFQFPKQDFYSILWVEALGFLGSKVINPHRRCYGPRDFQMARRSDPVVALVCEHLDAEKNQGATRRFAGIALPAKVTSAERLFLYYRAARALGQIVGHGLYSATVSNRVRTSELQKLFRDPFSDGKKARDLYLQWAARLDREGLRESIRKDHW